MKKVLLVAVLTFLGFANMNAQDIEFGAKAGLNFASVNGDNTKDLGTVTSFNFGLMAEIPFTEKFSFQPEVLFSGQGYSTGPGTDDVIALNYLNIPLMGKYYITKGLSFEAGPQVGFLLSANNNENDLDVKSSFNTLDFGVNLGLGYKLDNGLNFSARYNVGLSNINDVDGFSNKNRNGVFQVSVGYFFF
ncbi:PorT family protein [Polaribacter sp. Z014]|uniref:porin family protein n=1 Tax=unclassified Polaribacter TaxID=196858 RepID=UPI00193B6E4C|nr:MULTISPECIES: porin family protein [unclassified Polaribacter]MCL7763852.1 PorT family protein [Polaribacter sp. Z014]QVY66493.1 PorT family protein [Polaribacter sp. Q13]